MTPRKLGADIAFQKLELMNKILRDLAGLGEITPQRLSTESTVNYAVERMITQLVDLAVGVNMHVASTQGKIASDYRESFAAAAEIGLISKDLATAIGPSAGMRNVLIHEYLEIDVNRVAAAVPLALEQYRRYVTEAATYLAAAQS